MSMLMVRCPNSGHAISTGIEVDRSRFCYTPVFFGRTYCRGCQVTHEWFVRDAWVDDEPEPIRNYETAR